MKRVIPLLLLSLSAQADQLFLGYGGDNQSKVFNLGVREDVLGEGYIQAKLGYYGDLAIAAGAGMVLDLKPLETRAGLGVAAMSGGTLLGLNGEVYLGLRDRNRNGIGVQYENFGNRNFISIQLSTEF